MTHTFVLVNQTSLGPAGGPGLLPDAELAHIATVLSAWVNDHVRAAWNKYLNQYAVTTWPRGRAAPKASEGVWPVLLQDHIGVAGALGYHTIDTTGWPLSYIAVTDTLADNRALSEVISHEVAEAIVDQDLIQTVGPVMLNGQPSFVIKEVGDPVNGVSYLYAGLPVTDFALPSFFRQGAVAPYDHLNRLSAPFTPLPANGYTGYYFWQNGQLANGNLGVSRAEPDPDDLVATHHLLRRVAR